MSVSATLCGPPVGPQKGYAGQQKRPPGITPSGHPCGRHKRRDGLLRALLAVQVIEPGLHRAQVHGAGGGDTVRVDVCQVVKAGAPVRDDAEVVAPCASPELIQLHVGYSFEAVKGGGAMLHPLSASSARQTPDEEEHQVQLAVVQSVQHTNNNLFHVKSSL